MILVYTGNGKGKTSAALGTVFRALGHGKKCAVLQFIKSAPSSTGEYGTAQKLGLLWETYGEGFTWQQESLEPTRRQVEKGYERFRELCAFCDLIVLDEFTYTLSMNLLPQDDVIRFLSRAKQNTDIVITGRGAIPELCGIADTVSEIVEVKHHMSTVGCSIKGIDF